jgi:hypothetical protein
MEAFRYAEFRKVYSEYDKQDKAMLKTGLMSNAFTSDQSYNQIREMDLDEVVEIFDASIKVETTSLFDLVHVALVTEF